jgi:hypothetical protein
VVRELANLIWSWSAVRFFSTNGRERTKSDLWPLPIQSTALRMIENGLSFETILDKTVKQDEVIWNPDQRSRCFDFLNPWNRISIFHAELGLIFFFFEWRIHKLKQIWSKRNAAELSINSTALSSYPLKISIHFISDERSQPQKTTIVRNCYDVSFTILSRRISVMECRLLSSGRIPIFHARMISSLAKICDLRQDIHTTPRKSNRSNWFSECFRILENLEIFFLRRLFQISM